MLNLKGIVQLFEQGGENTSFDPLENTRGPASYKKFFYDTTSREEHKTIFSGLRIT
jgi:hypothetical protein